VIVCLFECVFVTMESYYFVSSSFIIVYLHLTTTQG